MKNQFKKVVKVVGKVIPIFIFIGVILLCTVTPAVVAQNSDESKSITTTTAVVTTTTNTTVTSSTTSTTVTTTSTAASTTVKPIATTTKKTTAKPTEETTIFYETTTKATTKTTAAPVSAPTGEYAVAREIWNYMKGLGWNDYVCAGVMGNIMAEVGGSTLNLQPTIYSPGGSYYGICQWSMSYFPEIGGASLSSQLNFMAGNVKSQINMFSSVHGYTYDSFLQSQDARTAARIFAAGYERCASSTYSIRENNAAVAYAYFVG